MCCDTTNTETSCADILSENYAPDSCDTTNGNYVREAAKKFFFFLMAVPLSAEHQEGTQEEEEEGQGSPVQLLRSSSYS